MTSATTRLFDRRALLGLAAAAGSLALPAWLRAATAPHTFGTAPSR
jgi:hypothetical protein